MVKLIYTLYLLGGVHGIILSIYLLGTKSNKKAKNYLGLFLLVFSINILLIYGLYDGWYYIFPHLMGVSYPFPLLYGPLFLTYTFRYFNRKIKVWSFFAQLLPFLCFTILNLPLYLSSAEKKIQLLEIQRSSSTLIAHPNLFIILSGLIILHLFIYGIYSLRFVQRKTHESGVGFRWIKFSTYGFLFYAICFTIYRIAIFNSSPNYVWICYFIMFFASISIYAIGYLGLKDSDNLISEKLKYQNSPLNKSLKNELLKKLNKAFDNDKIHLNKDLSLRFLSEHIGSSTHTTSQLINQEKGQSFTEFVNTKRIEEAKQIIENTKNIKLTYLHIDVGFGNKVSFYQAFKKNTGHTPAEFLKSIRK
ncbi:helix-turn-helix domain-containing protein [Ekhidna sp.]